jgi:hypothetical protein
MQDGDDNDAIVAKLIEESVGETVEKNTSKGSMNDMESQRVPSGKCNRIIDGFEESLAEIM